MFGDVVTAGDTLLISGFSILIVFLVLLLLSFMIDFFAYCLKRWENPAQMEKRRAAEMPKTRAPGAGPGAAEKGKTGDGKAGDEKAGEETAAEAAAAGKRDAVLIAAAIAACLSVEPDEIVVRRITRVEDHDSAWARNARLESIQ